MQFQLSAIFYGLAVLQGAIASPVAEPAVEVEARDIEPRGPSMGDIPWPRLPSLRRAKKGSDKNCPAPTNNQGNACSSGTQYCCTTSADGTQTCSNSEVCNAKIICCNNNSGFQMCIGEIDFNAPVTININIYKGGKGHKGGGYKAIKE
ncbi:hydrophobin [Fusarium agapanthi]|uniref:Hydrophobin n=1 Tax=Fusarium agapanthi TaxID=1803897 RepID=A0A9P5B965_9HYPO|nr:hydrophobin [Fusarium agapanthi]